MIARSDTSQLPILCCVSRWLPPLQSYGRKFSVPFCLMKDRKVTTIGGLINLTHRPVLRRGYMQGEGDGYFFISLFFLCATLFLLDTL